MCVIAALIANSLPFPFVFDYRWDLIRFDVDGMIFLTEVRQSDSEISATRDAIPRYYVPGRREGT